jgi:NADH dehydrogenase
MRVLVTGGSGVIGEGLLPALLAAGHNVRLLTRGADDVVREWPADVEPFPADVTQPEQLRGAADDCDAVVHITGIVEEEPPDKTFDRVNVGGTRNLLRECARAGSPTFVFVSSLGAERGTSEYHASKRDAEALVRGYTGHWIILRPGNVYGPGDDVISKLLTMHRTLPVIPVIGAGDHRFQPIWYLDVGKAIANAVEMTVPRGTYALAGEQVTTPLALLDAFDRITSRRPPRVPVPEFLAAIGTRVAETAGLSLPINEAQLTMLTEHNVIEPPNQNALEPVLHVTPTPLPVGLTMLADAQPEQRPTEGVGGMERKRFWGDITHSRFDAAALMTDFRRHVTDIMPIEFQAEPNTPREVIEGATLTARLPLRGHIQIRVVEVQPRVVTFATLRGHPLAGVVRFTAEDDADGAIRFSVHVFARAANMLDWLATSSIGAVAQNSTWRTVVERMIERSGGASAGVQQDTEILHGEESEKVERWVDGLIAEHKRGEHATQVVKS